MNKKGSDLGNVVLSHFLKVIPVGKYNLEKYEFNAYSDIIKIFDITNTYMITFLIEKSKSDEYGGDNNAA